MTWNLYHQGFPLDLSARLTAARTKADLVFHDAQSASPRSSHRVIIGVIFIDVIVPLVIIPDVIEYARCVCEVARRGLLPVSEVEQRVDDYLRAVASRRFSDMDPHGILSDSDVRGAVKRVKESSGWRAYLTERLRVTEQLVTADSAAKEVELPEETPAAPAKDGRRIAVGFGRTLQALIDECGWNLADLEQATDIDTKRISGHLYHQVFPQSKTLLAYAKAFSRKLRRTVTVKELRQVAPEVTLSETPPETPPNATTNATKRH